jgi:outer membrane protein insertion porin family
VYVILDTAIVSSISGIRPGDKFVHPGNDVFAKAINNSLAPENYFSNVKNFISTKNC